MGIEGEVIGNEREIGVEKGLQPSFLAPVDHELLVVPEQSVVNQHHLGTALGGQLEQLERGRDGTDDLLDLARSFDLEPNRPEIGEAVLKTPTAVPLDWFSATLVPDIAMSVGA